MTTMSGSEQTPDGGRGFRILLGKPVVPHEGRPGRKAAAKVLCSAMPQAFVSKVLVQCDGQVLAGFTSHDVGWSRFSAAAASLGECREYNDGAEWIASFEETGSARPSSMPSAASVADVITELAALRGNAGTAESRQEFADRGMQVLSHTLSAKKKRRHSS